jgi:hypothetical protein
VGHAATIAAGEWVTASGGWVSDRNAHVGAGEHRRHREISRFRDDPWHRPCQRQEDGQGIRREGFDVIQGEPDGLREATGIGPMRARPVELLEVPGELIQPAPDLELAEGTVIADTVGERPASSSPRSGSPS